MGAWQVASRCRDCSLLKDSPQGTTETAAAIASIAMPQQWAFRHNRKALELPEVENVFDFMGRIYRQRNEARLVKLGFLDIQSSLTWVIVLYRESYQLASPQPGCIQKHDRESHIFGTERRIRGVFQRTCDFEQAGQLLVREDVWPDNLMTRREKPIVRDKACRLLTAPIQTEVAHLAHISATIAGSQMLQGKAPGIECFCIEVRMTGCQKAIHTRQNTFLHG